MTAGEVIHVPGCKCGARRHINEALEAEQGGRATDRTRTPLRFPVTVAVLRRHPMSLRDRLVARLMRWTESLKTKADEAAERAEQKHAELERMIALEGDAVVGACKPRPSRPARRVYNDGRPGIHFHYVATRENFAEWCKDGTCEDVSCVDEGPVPPGLLGWYEGHPVYEFVAKVKQDACPACGKPKNSGPPETLCWCEEAGLTLEPMTEGYDGPAVFGWWTGSSNG